MNAKQRRCRSPAGFTLVELLVAIALLGLITTLLVAGLQLGTASRDRVTRASGELEDLRIIETFLRQRLVQALPFVSGSRRDLPQVRFEGDGNAVRFLVSSVFRDDARGVRELFVTLDGANKRKSLIVYDSPWVAGDASAGAPADAKAVRHVLLDAVTAIAFSYYGANPPQSKPQWHRDWRGAASLPALIRIRLQPAERSSPWPAITVAPRLKREDR
jgi:general secretion pathway protein J